MLNFILVGAGGAIGSMLRHGVGLLLLRLMGGSFPWGTMTVNLLGSFLIGIIVGVLAFTTQWSQDIRLFLVVGILGGFTTFSAFSLDAISLIEKGHIAPACLYIVGTVCFSLLATFAGLWLMRVLAS